MLNSYLAVYPLTSPMSPSHHESKVFVCEEILDHALERLLAEDDSTRISLSHRLHKDIAGGLVVCTSISEMIRHELGKTISAQEIEKLHNNLDSALRQVLGLVREITESLFPPVLKVFGIHAALQELARSITPRFPGSLLLNISGNEPGISLPRRLGAYRIVEELLDRCARSAAASWIEINARSAELDGMDIFIDHDGRGDIWTPAEDDTTMHLIQARCQLLGAAFKVSSSSLGDRTRVALSISATIA